MESCKNLPDLIRLEQVFNPPSRGRDRTRMPQTQKAHRLRCALLRRSLGQSDVPVCRRCGLFPAALASHAADAIDLLCNFGLDDRRQVGVQPLLQHWLHHFTDDIIQRRAG